MRTELRLYSPEDAREGAETLVLVGRKTRLTAPDLAAHLPEGLALDAMLDGAAPGDDGETFTTWRTEAPKKVVVVLLPELCSRHNSPARPDAIADLVGKSLGKKGPIAVLLALDLAEHARAAVAAVARSVPSFSRKTGGKDEPLYLRLACLPGDGLPIDLDKLELLIDGVRLAASLVDMPTSELDSEAFAELAVAQAARLGAEVNVLSGETLAHAGLGGLWNVGKAAKKAPALVILTHTPEGFDPAKGPTVAWVGKGIVYDTGGLSLKTKEGMVGMKGDMGGAAAVLGAFVTAVRQGVTARVVALLCLAENAIGPDAYRPDDILTLYSGKTVEVNNTDAEGRLVLADGVAYAVRHFRPDVLVDLATLTGAQLMSTGRHHAAIVSNDCALESAAMAAGRKSGDLVFPLPYCPEFFRKEFKSKVADLKNSVKDRMNAQSSCAAQFIAESLGDFAGRWLHVDMAGPSDSGERGTGYGVALLLALLEHL